MTGMTAIVPDPWVDGSKLTDTGDQDGVMADLSVSIPTSDGATFTIRTLVRLGERINNAGYQHGTMTDDISVATLAAVSRLLQAIPEGLTRKQMQERAQAAQEEAEAAAQDRAQWTLTAVALHGVQYALWHRSLAGGFAAHADLGDRLLIAWGGGSLPQELMHVQRVDLTNYLQQ